MNKFNNTKTHEDINKPVVIKNISNEHEITNILYGVPKENISIEMRDHKAAEAALRVVNDKFSKLGLPGSTNKAEYSYLVTWRYNKSSNIVIVFVEGNGVNAFPGNHCSINVNISTGSYNIFHGE